jgi:bifunctional DNA-binding transcriptional regulator/antitoxin component of YhaV-PrlF toxin-antitoxin module
MPLVASKRPEQKRVTITSKRQFTIPQKFYTELGFDRDAVCTMGDGMLVIQPVSHVSGGGEFAEQILSDLIAEGFSGQELLDEFKTRQAEVRPAVEAMLEAAKAAASGTGEYSTYDDIFGSEE